ncbi:MAG TPA: 6-phosphogluconolactonase [Acidimicrobiales bacterium]
MHHELREFDSADLVADAAADYVVEYAKRCIRTRGEFIFAVSGGRTPWAMFERLATKRLDWSNVTIYQVDERIAPAGDPTRNLTNLEQSLGSARPTIIPMPVNDADLNQAARAYSALVPERLDLVHLGLGPDGHTASLLPGDPDLDVRDSLVAVSALYQGEHRMTLTYPALARAEQLLWLVTGDDKKTALALLLAGDASIPAGLVEAHASLVMADVEALS